MSNYSYEAVDAGGLKIEGKLEVLDQNEAIRRVKEMGLFPVRIVQSRERRRIRNQSRAVLGQRRAARTAIQLPYFGGRVKGAVLAVFTRQLATLIEAGMPLLRGLRILQEQEESPVLKGILESVAEQIEGGGSLSEAMAMHPKVFNPLYINMVKAGEMSGALEITLRRLAEFMEKAQKIRGKVKAAMFYPVSVMVVATGILTLLMVYIVPKFREVFNGFGIALPGFTVFVLNVSSAIRGYIGWIVAGLFLAWVGFLFALRTKNGRRLFDLENTARRQPAGHDIGKRQDISLEAAAAIDPGLRPETPQDIRCHVAAHQRSRKGPRHRTLPDQMDGIGDL